MSTEVRSVGTVNPIYERNLMKKNSGLTQNPKITSQNESDLQTVSVEKQEPNVEDKKLRLILGAIIFLVILLGITAYILYVYLEEELLMIHETDNNYTKKEDVNLTSWLSYKGCGKTGQFLGRGKLDDPRDHNNQIFVNFEIN